MIASFARNWVRTAVAAATVAVLGFAGEAKATFSITVTRISGPTFTTFTSTAASGGVVDLMPGAQQTLNLNWTFSTPDANTLSIDTLSFFYLNTQVSPPPVASRFTVLITENTRTVPGNASILSSTMNLLGGTGATVNTATISANPGGATASFPTPITASPVFASYNAQSQSFTGSNPSTFSLFLDITLVNGNNISFFNTNLTATTAPAPLTGVAAVSVLPLLGLFGAARRRFARTV